MRPPVLIAGIIACLALLPPAGATARTLDGRTRPVQPVTATPAADAATTAAARVSGRVSPRERRYAQRVLHWTNVARRHHDLPRLRALPCLRRVAMRWSDHMARTGEFEHQSLSVVYRRCDRISTVGENIAYHYDGPRAMVRMWMESPGHRANILDPDYTHLGVGIAKRGGRWYGTQDFAGRRR